MDDVGYSVYGIYNFCGPAAELASELAAQQAAEPVTLFAPMRAGRLLLRDPAGREGLAAKAAQRSPSLSFSHLFFQRVFGRKSDCMPFSYDTIVPVS